MMTPKQIAAHERRAAAIHEAGHYVIAKWRRVDCGSWIFPTVDPGPFDTLWVGKTEFYEGMTPASRRLIGVAGAVAEECWRERYEAHIGDDPYKWDDHWWDPNVMSESDWKAARTAPGEPNHHFDRAVDKVYAQLNSHNGPLWSELCQTACDLITNVAKPARRKPTELEIWRESIRARNAAQEAAARAAAARDGVKPYSQPRAAAGIRS